MTKQEAITAAEKKPNKAALKAARKRDFTDLVKSCIKVGMPKPRAIEFAKAVLKANEDLYIPTQAGDESTAKRFLWPTTSPDL
jgi:hypothetical protein